MDEIGDILAFAEGLIHRTTDTYCSELQRRILIAALQEERKTYDQLAQECGYSPKYVKQDVAPKLWQMISQALDTKVTKANVRSVLQQNLRGVRGQSFFESAWIEGDGFGDDGSVLNEALLEFDLPPPVDWSKAKILLVDDQPQNLQLLSCLLEEQGYEVCQAINGAIALKAIANNPPNLILLDIYLPEMDGYTICQKIKADPASHHIPIIFISALHEPRDKVRAFNIGGCDYITKPFQIVEVLARVEHQLKIQQLQHQLMRQNVRLQRAIKALKRLTAIDEFTQVASRRCLDAYLLTCWQQARQEGLPLTLMLVQVKYAGFCDLCCEEGNLIIGDRTLYEIAQILQQGACGSKDLVARYGSLTFAIVLPQQTQQQGEQLASKLINRLESVKASAQMSDRILLSIGMASVMPAQDDGLENFLELCDRHLQQAKLEKGNCFISL